MSVQKIRHECEKQNTYVKDKKWVCKWHECEKTRHMSQNQNSAQVEWNFKWKKKEYS